MWLASGMTLLRLWDCLSQLEAVPQSSDELENNEIREGESFEFTLILKLHLLDWITIEALFSFPHFDWFFSPSANEMIKRDLFYLVCAVPFHVTELNLHLSDGGRVTKISLDPE